MGYKNFCDGCGKEFKHGDTGYRDVRFSRESNIERGSSWGIPYESNQMTEIQPMRFGDLCNDCAKILGKHVKAAKEELDKIKEEAKKVKGD